ncbi:T9SS type A sorting domain-containing protein [Fibrella sp. ES10-3-2-2]|nr:hypothetical protein A6C57_20205 [Fibrella sp. ES10-3-2-2]
MNPRLLRFLCLVPVLLARIAWGQSVSLTTLGSTYTQNFNELSNTAGSTMNNLTITGWFMTESGGSTRDNEQYGVDIGSSNAGDTYSYGAAGSVDRAFGCLRSGTLVPSFGAYFVNNTGSTINSFQISYTGEEWRLGGVARTDQLNFEYSTNATDLSTGVWTSVAALNFVTPNTVTAGAKDGNAAENRTNLSATITGISIPNGAGFWIRWTDSDPAGADDGLAVDDFSLTPNATSTPSLSINDVTLTEGNSGTTAFNFTISLSSPAPAGGVSFDVATADGTATTATGDYIAKSLTGQTIPAGSSTYTFSVLINGDGFQEANEAFFVNVTNVTGTTVADAQGLGIIQNDDVSILPIYSIQGAGHTSPLVGQSVVTTGIVTALRSNGFYIQNPTPDSDEATSEGLFVFTSSAPVVAIGDALQVTGTIAEFRAGGAGSANLTTTELTSPAVIRLSSGNSLPATTVLGNGGRAIPSTIIDNDAAGNVETSGTFDPATDGIDFYESLEGMLVQINNPVAVGPTASSGEIWVLADNGAAAGLRTARGGILIQSTDFNPERIQIDNVLYSASSPMVTVGTQLNTITGVVDYNSGNFAVLPATAPVVSSPSGLTKEVTNLRGDSRKLTVATFNVENLDPGDGAQKFTSLATAVVTNLQSPDIIVVEEIQDNNGPVNDAIVSASTTYQTLVDAIASAGGPTYAYRQIDPVDDQDGGEPGGNIRQGFLYNPVRVSFMDRPGGNATTATTVSASGGQPVLSASPGRIDPTNAAFAASRKPLVGEFMFNGQTVFVIGNHFNSKGGDQPLFGKFQPPVLSSEAQRIQQATIVKDFVQSILAISASANVVVAGDLNDFEFAAPLTILKNSGLTALIETLPANERYTYNFEGNAQTLDHILVSNSLLSKLNGFDVVHMNSEFADQISDHDPSVAQFSLEPPVSVTIAANASAICPGTPVAFSLTVAGLTAGQTYSYTISNGTNTISAVGQSATLIQTSVIPTVNGAFTATVSTNDNLVATAVSGPITINEVPLNTSLTSASVCTGQSATLLATSTGGSSYTLSDGQQSTSGQFVVSAAGTYTVIAGNASGCTATATATLTVNSLPTASLTASATTVTVGQSVLLSASGGTSYLWSTGATGSSITVTPPAGSTVYSVVVTNLASCSSIASVSITAIRLLDVVGPARLCIKSAPPANEAVTLPLAMTVTGGTLPYMYSWSYKAPNSTNYKGIATAGTAIGKVSFVPVPGGSTINITGTKGNLNGLQNYLIRLTVTDKTGATVSEETLLDGSCMLGGSNARMGRETDELVQVRVYPNPVQEMLEVDIQGLTAPARIVLLDVAGRLQQQWDIAPVAGVGKLRVAVSDLPEGVYILNVKTAEGILHRQRLLKQR